MHCFSNQISPTNTISVCSLVCFSSFIFVCSTLPYCWLYHGISSHFSAFLNIANVQVHLHTISCSWPRLSLFNSPKHLILPSTAPHHPHFFLRNKKRVLRRQGIFDLHVGNVIVEGNGNHLLHGANEAVLLTPIFNDQGVRLVRVKHDVVRSDNHDTADHAL